MQPALFFARREAARSRYRRHDRHACHHDQAHVCILRNTIISGQCVTATMIECAFSSPLAYSGYGFLFRFRPQPILKFRACAMLLAAGVAAGPLHIAVVVVRRSGETQSAVSAAMRWRGLMPARSV
ncbi:hypothetical protein [Pseudoxanthomonas dokdonensis]|uniref:hypothetical protein n=1 Tax=Pseudoxanthomonas dokdonensis TaxID=344882 RepID=UPI0012EEB3B4|nr:hypothetical protein [Pseudoxanthomonas dokdonensis]